MAPPRRLGPYAGRIDGMGDTRLAVYERDGADPNLPGPPAAEWVAEHRAVLTNLLETVGTVRVRGALRNAEELAAVARRLAGEPLPYTERSTPRSRVGSGVYTSTEYPASETITQHNENAYASSFPHLLFFACLTPARSGGETPLADVRAVARRLPADLSERYRRLGVVYSRSYREGMGLTWQEAFQTEDRAEVERYCSTRGIETIWTDYGLRTRQHGPALVTHPRTGEECWFNQAHLFHPSNLPPATREALGELFPEEEMPRTACYGDGTAIPDEEMDEVRAAFDACTYAFAWEQGDLLLVNNLLVSHGRRPYTGQRQTLVAMTGQVGTARRPDGVHVFTGDPTLPADVTRDDRT
ncbi:alpha-ketoglutarate-dependent taurine dioxygenase [Streptacidiphilus sp. MAP12-33]|uniref:TauD/TfdA family dioxygenase n=1 Tax=Streptacidiphilus sp. MAP12-33 TaxID=3156266 RepID=UPI0035144BB2